MLFRHLALPLAFLAFFVPSTVYAEPVGTIIEIEGTVTVSRGGVAHAAQLKEEIEMLDVVETGANSRAFILLIDDTEWTLSEKARLQVTEYLFDADDNTDNKARYSLLGAFRYVSGLVAKKQDPDVTIATEYGSIGIRGTDFWAGPDESGEYGVYVDEGAVDVKTVAGQARVNRGEGTFVKGRNFAPRAAQAWKKEHIDRMRGTVRLQRPAEVRERRQQQRARQMEMRGKFRESIKGKLEQLRERRGLKREQQQEKRGELKQQLQEKWQERREQRQQQGQQQQLQRQNWQEKRGELQEKRQQRRLRAP